MYAKEYVEMLILTIKDPFILIYWNDSTRNI